jgi:hypothetical protein
MVTKITRREWAAILGTAAVKAAPAQVQAAGAQSAASLEAEARAELAMDLQQIAGFPLPAGAEPAFIFEP